MHIIKSICFNTLEEKLQVRVVWFEERRVISWSSIQLDDRQNLKQKKYICQSLNHN